MPHFGPTWINTLSGEIIINEKDLQNARKVWSTFHCENIGDYHDLYFKCETLILADVFVKFCNLFKDVFDLDATFYFSTPNISWDAMLKTTKTEIVLLTNIDMIPFCEKAIGGGLNGIGEKRYIKINNPYLIDYDSSKTCSYGLFLDVVNLYGGTVTKKKAYGNF